MKITVTTRTVLLFLCGTLPLMSAGTHLGAFQIFLVVNILLAALLWLDWRLSPHPNHLEVDRLCPGKLSIGEPNEIVLQITNHSFRHLELTVRDEFPHPFRADREILEVHLDPRSEIRLRYEVTPDQRGDFLFGDITVRYRGLLELVEIQQSFPARTKVEVYPNIRNISRLDLSLKRSHLVESGLITERRRGSGTEFESLRAYVRGDEFRKIDWKASARKSILITRNFQNETNQSVLLLIDQSRSLGVKIGRYTLLDAAVNAALLIGHYIVRKEDKVGLLTFSRPVHQYMPPRRGKRHFHEMLRNLYNLQPRSDEAEFLPAFKHLATARLRRSLMLLFTDLSSGNALDNLMKSVSLLAGKHVLVVVSLIDPCLRPTAESTPATYEEAARKAVALELLGRFSQIKRDLEHKGIGLLFLTPEEAGSAILATYIRLKLREIL